MRTILTDGTGPRADNALFGSTLSRGGQLWVVGPTTKAPASPRTLIVANCPACA